MTTKKIIIMIKKMIFGTVLGLGLFFSTSQNCFSQEKTKDELNPAYGLVAGMNSSTYSGTILASRIGFHVGGFAEIPIFTENLFFCPSAQLSLKGAGFGKYTDNPYYLDIPIFLKYKCPVNDKISLFGSAGPTASYGLFGKGEDPFSDQSTYNLFSGSDATLNRFDISIGFNLGAELSQHYQLSFGYDLGLLNVVKDYDQTSNRVFKISLAYLF